MTTGTSTHHPPAGATAIAPFVKAAPATVRTDATLRVASRLMRSHDTAVVAVLDDGLPVGLLSEHDLAQAIADGADPDVAHVGAWMTTPPITAHGDDHIAETAVAMLRNALRAVPVVGTRHRIGVVHLQEILVPLLVATEAPGERLPYMPPD